MPLNVSTLELVVQAKNAYKAKRYEQAVQAFSEAIDLQHREGNVPIALLDNRAALLEKLERFQEALRDGRSMIKLDRRDIKGYLRTGRLLQRMKDDKKCQTALQIYVLGLRNVPPSNENYRVLQMVHDKLTLQLSPPKSVDPFVALPVELVEIILNYLEFHQRLSCLRVTKHWRTFLLSRTQFWRNLDFSHAKRNVNLRTIQRYLYYSQQRITRVTLHRHSDQNTLNALTKLKSLQSLSFGSTEYSTGSIIPALATNHLKGGSLTLVHIGENTLLTLDGVSQALKVCPTLTRAWFDSVQRKGRIGTTVEWPEDLKNLLDLRMRVPQPPPIAGQSHLSPCLPTLYKSATNLRAFEYSDPTWSQPYDSDVLHPLIHLESFTIQGQSFFEYLFPRTIQSITLRSVSGRHGAFRNPTSRTNVTSLRDLKALEASYYSAMDVCEHFANAPGGHTTTQLRRLVLDFADSEFLLPDLTEKGILARCPGIEELGLTHCALDDKKGETLPILLHCLRRVDLSYTKVTGVTVRALVQKLPKGQLEWLNVSYCDMLSPDAVEWARAQGVSVKYSMGERGGGKGRKIRYA